MRPVDSPSELILQPEDRVLVAVINRKRDLVSLLRDGWYRIPVEAAPGCIDMDWIAFFCSGSAADGPGAVRYYGRLTGYELFRRRDLLPLEADHPRRNRLYFKLQFREILVKEPPILNPTRRRISFLFTDWERFANARIISDLSTRPNHSDPLIPRRTPDAADEYHTGELDAPRSDAEPGDPDPGGADRRNGG